MKKYISNNFCSCKNICSFDPAHLVVSHESRVYLTWRILIIFCSTISSFEYANVAAFKYHFDEKGGTGPWLWGWEFVFTIDLLVKFSVDFCERTITDGHVT